jgi:hypothetical protein
MNNVPSDAAQDKDSYADKHKLKREVLGIPFGLVFGHGELERVMDVGSIWAVRSVDADPA